MVNKVLVLVLGAVVLASMVVGGLLGMQFAGGGGDGSVAETPTSGAVSTTDPASGPDRSTPESTATATAAATVTSTPTPTFSPDSVNATAVELHLRALINEEVRDGAQPVRPESTLDEMAQFHSDNMAAQGYPAHDAGGFSTRQRYEEFDRYSHCRVPSDNNAGIRDGVELEVVERISVNASADPSEEDLARQLVAEWTADETATERLTLVNADRAGVGVTVTEDARLYATVDLC